MQQNDDLLDLPELEDSLPDLPELEDKETFYDKYGEPYIRPALQAAGAAGGGIIGSAAAPVAGTIAGGALGYGAGTKAADVLAAYFGSKRKPGTLPQELAQSAKDITEGATYEMAGPVLSKGLGAVGSKISSLYPGQLKPNAGELIQASKTIGAPVKPGTILKGEIPGKIESSLEQTPYIGGNKVKKTLEEYRKAVSKTAEEITEGASTQTPYELSNQAKKQLEASLEQKLAPAEKLYGEVETILPQVEADKTGIQAKIKALKESYEGDDGAMKILNSVEKSLDNITTVQGLKDKRSIIGKMPKAGMSGNEYRAINELYGSFSEARTSSLLKSANENFTPDMAAQIAQKLKQADSLYKNTFSEVGQVIGEGKGPIKEQVSRYFEKVPSTEGARSLFPSKEIDRLSALKKFSPETFETAKSQKVMDIVNASSDKYGINTTKLIKEIDKLPPEAQKLIFKENQLEKFNALKKLHEAAPDKAGQSGTPQGLELMSMFNLTGQATSLLKYKLLKSMEKRALSQKTSKLPAMTKALPYASKYTKEDENE